jgi:hypothetical protein
MRTDTVNSGLVSVLPPQTARQKAYPFAQICRALMLAESWAGAAVQVEGREHEFHPDVTRAIKAAVSAQTPADLMSSLPYYDQAWAFVQSLKGTCTYDALFDQFRHFPANVAVRTASTIAGSTVTEGQAAPVSRFDLTGSGLTLRKVTSLVALNKEVLLLNSGFKSLLDELQAGISLGTDVAFLAHMISGAPSSAASADITANIKTLLNTVSGHGSGQPHLVVLPATASSLSTKQAAAGAPLLFPEMSPTGGKVCGVPVLVSPNLPASTALMLDPGGIAASPDGTIELMAASSGMVQMDNAPANPTVAATVLISLWQQGLKGLRCTRYFAAEKIRPNSAAVLTGVNW